MTAIPLISENGEGKTHERNWHWHVSPEGRRNHHRHTHTLSLNPFPSSFIRGKVAGLAMGPGRQTILWSEMPAESGLLFVISRWCMCQSLSGCFGSLFAYSWPPLRILGRRERTELFFSLHTVQPWVFVPFSMRQLPSLFVPFRREAVRVGCFASYSTSLLLSVSVFEEKDGPRSRPLSENQTPRLGRGGCLVVRPRLF